VLLVVAILAMPVIFEIPKINAIGPYWQGRYWLPLLVGIPLTATAASGHRPIRRLQGLLDTPLAAGARVAAAVLLGAVIVWAQVAAFVLALHRYTTGLDRPAGTPIQWMPPGGITFVVVTFVLGELLLAGAIAWMVVRPQRARPSRPGRSRPPAHKHSRRSGRLAAHT